ncbi:Uncharacterised protein [Mycobacteroides abscessus subsp. abscessus]|nr:Uncharacterised protein [Mycobacteroides abscessus subsp. abscessus]
MRNKVDDLMLRPPQPLSQSGNLIDHGLIKIFSIGLHDLADLLDALIKCLRTHRRNIWP